MLAGRRRRQLYVLFGILYKRDCPKRRLVPVGTMVGVGRRRLRLGLSLRLVFGRKTDPHPAV
jgi:hypothetical protein